MIDLRRQFSLLREAPGFRLLFVATFASSFGTLLAAVALAIDIKERTGSGAWVSVLLFVDFLPAVAIGLLLGPFVDRLSRRGLMIGSDLARAAIFLALPFVDSAAWIVVLAGLAGFATGLFRPSAYAGLPNLVASDRLPAANALLQGIENISWAAGPVVGGLLVELGGPSAAYWINGVSFLFSALLIARIAGRLQEAERGESRGHWRDLADGMRLVRRSPLLFAVLVAWSVAMVGKGIGDVAEVFLATDALDGGTFGYGLLFGAIGLGLAIGSFGGGALAEERPLRELYGGAVAVMALGYGLAAISPNIWVAAACCVVLGIGNGVAGICNALFVQRGAPDHLRGRAFTVVMSVNFALLGLGYVLAGPLVDSLGARWAWGIVAAVTFIAAGAGFVLVRDAAPQVTQLQDPADEPVLQRTGEGAL